MDFALSPLAKSLLERLRAFLVAEVEPGAASRPSCPEC
jgi:hypothetical protein